MAIAVISNTAEAQNFIMADGAVFESCTGAFFDSGGPSGSYSNNEDFTATICPLGGAGSGPATKVTFSMWNVQAGAADQLRIYDGATTAGTLLATGQGSSTLLNQTFTSTDATGCLTFHWTSSAGGIAPGWQADIGTAGDPGIGGSVTVCSNDQPFNMRNQLGGTPDAGGQWQAPGGSNHSQVFNPAVDITGAYTYTTSPTSPCTGVSSTLTVTLVNAPNAGTNGVVTFCSNGAVTPLFNSLGGMPQAGGTWTRPAGTAFSGNFNPAVNPPGTYTYTVVGSPPCSDATATVTVSVNAAPDPGTDASITICSADAPFPMTSKLGGTPQAGGVWTGPGGAVVSATFDPAAGTAGNYTYTVSGTAPCTPQFAVLSIVLQQAPDPGFNATIALCSDDAPVNMTQQLNGTPVNNGTWAAPGGQPHVVMFNPANDTPGVYTYTVAGQAPCVSHSATLTISINQAPVAGTNGSATVCSTDASFSLLSELGGTPSTNGTWDDPDGNAHSANFNPATDDPGVYVYTVPGIAPCSDATATVTVTVNLAPNAGSNNTLTVCSNSTPFALITQLNGTPNTGGTWTRPNGAVHGNNFNPSVHPQGIYTYTVEGLTPCSDASATVNIMVNQAPVAGTNGTVTACSNDAVVDLFSALGGSPSNTGSWSDPNGAAHTGTLNPVSDITGLYTYLVQGIAPCINATATVNVTITQAPNSGSNGNVTVCSDGPTVLLRNELGGTPATNGAWTRPNGTAHSGNFNPANDVGGSYTYTVVGTGPCADASATVQVIRNIAPKAGNDGAITVCSNGAQVQLLSILGGAPDATGTWHKPSGVLHGQTTFTPGTDLPGSYMYVVPGNAPCTADTAFASVNVNNAPNAGSNGSIEVCDDASFFSLYAQLNGTPTIGGTWKDPLGASHSANFTPGTDMSGVYTYTVAGNPPCAPVSATVLVSVEQHPDAGNNGTATVCSTEPAFNLFSELGGTPQSGGTWQAPGGGTHNGIFTPGTSAPGIYTYTIAVPPSSPCSSDAATVNVTVNAAPDAGDPGSLTICNDAGNVDLFTILNGTPGSGGTWDDVDNSGGLNGGVLDPTGLSPNDYDFDYTVPGIGNCPAAVTRVTVTIVSNLNAGSNTSRTICGDNPAYVLFAALNGNPQAGGTWVDTDNTNALINGNTFNSTLVSAGTYHFTYHLTGTTGCSDDSAVLTVTVREPADAGVDGTASVCSNGNPFNMFLELGGTPQTNGTWRNPSNQVHSNMYNPAADSPGAYTYRAPGVSPCLLDIATVTVTEVAAPNAGTGSTVDVCANDAAFSMVDELGGTPALTGTWTAPNNTTHGNTFQPNSDVGGLYVYTVQGTGPCANAIAGLTVNLDSPPFAGNDNAVTKCSSDPQFLLFTALGGNPASNGTWSDPSGTAHSGLFTPGTSTPGDYEYEVAGTGNCASDIATVTVFVNEAPDAGTNSTYGTCSNSGSMSLITQLGGTPDLGGTWKDPNNVAHNGTLLPGTQPNGGYIYTVLGVAPCPNAGATVVVSISQAPWPGTNATTIICSDAPAFAMVDELGGNPDLGGTWKDAMGVAMNGIFLPGPPSPNPTPPGTYTYTVNGAGACSAASSTLTVGVNQAANAGVNAAATYCITDGSQQLLPLLGPTAQPGGTWLQPNGSSHSGFFLPGTNPAGVYKYIKAGTAPCLSDTAKVTVNVNQSANAGTNGVTTICDDESPFNLLSVLGGNPSPIGVWTDPDLALHTGVFLPGTNPPGVYSYVVNGQAPCASASSSVTVIQHHQPDAGSNSTIAVCSDGANVILFSELGGTPETGGTWTHPVSGQVSGSYAPGLSLPGVYTYKLTAIAPCVLDQATVTVNQSAAADAGQNSSALICSDQQPVSLVSLLNGTPNFNGSWTDPNSTLHLGQFDPMIDPTGTYTYTVTGTPPCMDMSSTVQIDTVPSPDAGSDGNLTVCDDDDSVFLYNGLQGTPGSGGTWTDIDVTGELAGGLFNASAVALGDYHFRYTIAAVGQCPLSSAVVTVTVTNMLNAGNDATVQICDNEDALVLIDQLGGNPQAGGIWTDANGAVISGVFDANAAGLGTYDLTYQLPASATCTPDTALLTLEVVSGPSAGTNGFSPVCSIGAPFDLIMLLGGSPDMGGSWFGPALIPHGVQFDPANDPAGVYTYVVDGAGGCFNDSATATIQLIQTADPGQSNNIDVCSSSLPFDLFTMLNGTPTPGGSWFGPSSLPHSSQFNPLSDPPGPYTYEVPGTPPCATASAIVNVTLNVSANAGGDATTTVCSNELPFAMITALSGTPDQGGTWFLPMVGMHGAQFDPATDPSGNYLYVVQGTPPCSNDTATLTVNLLPAPNAGIGGTLDTCGNFSSLDLFSGLSGSPDQNGTWYDLSGTGQLTGSILDLTALPPSQYDFMYTVPMNANCDSSAALLTIDLTTGGANAGISDSVRLCGSDTAFNLFDVLLGNPDGNGVWVDIDGTGANTLWSLNLTLLDVDSTFAFTYVVSGGGGVCGVDSATIWVTVNDYPDPGTNAVTIMCETSDSLLLTDALDGTPDPGGVWFAPNQVPTDSVLDPSIGKSGWYSYQLSGNAYCPDTISFLLVTINDKPNPGFDANVSFCYGEATTELLGWLGPTADPDGVWTDLNGTGALTGDVFDIEIAGVGVHPIQYVVSALECENDTAVVTVTAIGDVFAGAITGECDEHYRTYTVSFELTGSIPGNYVVSGVDGVMTDSLPYIFTSDVLLDSQEPTITISDPPYNCSTLELELISPCMFDDAVFVPQSISPDGDGINDGLVILGIEEFPENEIAIYNRWGAVVYEETGYDNETKVWTGTADNVPIEGPLPDATYYYVLDLKNGEKPYAGYIYLNR